MLMAFVNFDEPVNQERANFKLRKASTLISSKKDNQNKLLSSGRGGAKNLQNVKENDDDDQ